MTNHEFALSDLAARRAGTDASLSTSLRDILTAAFQELIEAELTSVIGAGHGERAGFLSEGTIVRDTSTGTPQGGDRKSVV